MCHNVQSISLLSEFDLGPLLQYTPESLIISGLYPAHAYAPHEGASKC